MALTILASTLVYAIAAGHTARQAARAALEARQAKGLLESVLARTPSTPGTSSAAVGGFTWRLIVSEPALVAGSTALCRRDATVTAQGTARTYSLATAAICPAGAS